MTTVSQRDDLTLGQALTLWMSGREQLVPRDLVYPPGQVEGRDRPGQQPPTSSAPRTAPSTPRSSYLKYAHRRSRWRRSTRPGPSAGKLQRRRRDRRGQRQAGGQPRRSSPRIMLKATKPGDKIVDRLSPQERAAGRRHHHAGLQPRPRLQGILGVGVLERAVGAVHHRLQPRQHRRAVRGTDVQPRRHRQAHHR